jgi:hypothetical protein
MARSRYVAGMFEVVIVRRSPMRWEWRVCDRKGAILMHGSERTRRAARYEGDRALFLLLATGTYDPRQGSSGPG